MLGRLRGPCRGVGAGRTQVSLAALSPEQTSSALQCLLKKTAVVEEFSPPNWASLFLAIIDIFWTEPLPGPLTGNQFPT